MIYTITGPIAREAICKRVMSAPENWVVRITEPTRSLEQNSLLHAELQEISDKLKWAGESLDVDDWRRLMTAGWLRAIGKNVRVLPSIDGHGFDVLYQRTSTLSKAEMTELIEYIRAWKAESEEFA